MGAVCVVRGRRSNGNEDDSPEAVARRRNVDDLEVSYLWKERSWDIRRRKENTKKIQQETRRTERRKSPKMRIKRG
ncbi:uncharacterized protein SPSK_10677 [Sporothrix schenckii 1099-18]|uniref:Uncharacterized protein n=1 Tax=Sporothrix schenckii 1099-18 TaxID=1397361 RepID=A0A0F2LTL2_SPOSC|nr:uncharacterized protein SPSK_10677 [Sporothrix schenckii 1099-18]KJR80194.1 hypothetical protein SPSK_10677 [Sporothrix schenckii 1099-18]